MGWISTRHMQRGGSLNSNPRNNGSRNGPLRHIVLVERPGRGLFDKDVVRFECGHVGTATIGAERGRCKKCKRGSGEAGRDKE